VAFSTKMVSTCVTFHEVSLPIYSGLCEAYPKESRVNELKTTSIITIVSTTSFLVLRLYSRWLKTRRLWSDDAYAIIAAVSVFPKVSLLS
jgi:hypothetical protein